jgi:hypothetical protein
MNVRVEATPRRFGYVRARARPHAVIIAGLGFVALLALAGAWLMYETRGTTLWFDEWLWALEYRDTSLSGFLAPHNGHPTLIPVLIYRALFALVGIDHSAPYRAVGIAGHLACVAVLYVYALRRVGVLLALAASAVILFLGPGWQNIVWPLQIGWLVSIAAILGALLALDRRDRTGEVAAAALILLALASSGPGIALAAGLVVEVLRSRGVRALWIVAVPFALLGVWWVIYQDASSVQHMITLAPGFAADSAAATLSAVAGLAGPLISDDPTTLAWGRPLAVAALALLIWRMWHVRPVPTRVLTLLAILAAFWLVTAVQRAGLGPAESSRYVYVGAVFIVALAVELARGVAMSPRAWWVLGAAVALGIVGNVGDMRTGARFLRDQGLQTRAGLAAVEAARPVVPPDQPLTVIPGYPLVVVRAGQYFSMERDLGTPAASLAELARAPENVRRAADDAMVRMHGVQVVPVRSPAHAPTSPAVDASSGGTVSQAGGCVAFTPAAAGPASAAAAVELTVPAEGLVLSAANGDATVAVRRFAAGFPDAPIGRIAPGGSGRLSLRPDLAPNAWHVRLSPEGRMTACAAAGSG